MKLLWLLPDTRDCAAATQARLLAPLLHADVATLADLGVRGLYRRLKADPPDVLHAWRLPAVRVAAALKLATRAPWKLVVSEPFRGGRASPLDRWLVGRADRVASLPLAVAPPAKVQRPAEWSAEGRVVMLVGPLNAGHGGRDAIWAADILKYAVPDVQLAIVGDGPDLPRLRAFAQNLGRAREFTHFLPRRPDAAALLAHADVVWVPGRSGRQIVLEAQAAGVPVVAARLPGPMDLIDDGVTGVVVPSRDPPALAAATRQLLDDPKLARRIGDSGRSAAAAHAPEAVARLWQALYFGGI